jgi:PKD repeat protein
MTRAQTAPPCTTFDDHTLDNWITVGANPGFATHGGGLAADVSDQSGASFFVAPAAYRGDWLAFSGGCGELCFDINIIDDSLPTSTPVSFAFEITDGTFRAMFKHNPVAEGTGWHTFCAPVGPLVGGNLPSNGQGTWTMLSGTNNDFPTLLHNVTSFKFDIDLSSSQTEHIQLDNICFHPQACATPDFTVNPNPACVNQPVTFTNTSTGATSSSWTFTSGTPASSTQTSPPTVTYASAGTFPVTLCINGSTNCVTKNVTVSPTPPTPVITGSASACQKKATYCVTAPVSGVIYTWSILPATAGTLSNTTGTCTTITWSSASGAVVVVTATNAQGCRAVSRITVAPCDTHNTCCLHPVTKIVNATLPFVGGMGGHYEFRPVITTTGSVKRVVIDILSASVQYPTASCGVSGSFPPSITQALPPNPLTTLTPSQPVPGSSEAIWFGSATLTNTTLPMIVTLPPHNSDCTDIVRLCVKYTVTDADCRTCEILECYEFRRVGNP